MVIELSDAMFAKLVKLSRSLTYEEAWGEKSSKYRDGESDGQIGLARTFLDEAVIIHD